MKKEKIILVGGGGHCKVVIDAIRKLGNFEIVGITDNNNIGKKIFGIEIVGRDDTLKEIYSNGCRNSFITVGSAGSTSIREKIFAHLKITGFKLPNIIHPSSIIARGVKIGEGSFLAAGTVMGPDTLIGSNVIVNTGSNIDHDCVIGDFAHIAPGATLSGGVVVGKNSHIGTNAAVIEYKKIGSGTIIGAGSVVVEDIPDNVVAYGNPCKIKRNRK